MSCCILITLPLSLPSLGEVAAQSADGEVYFLQQDTALYKFMSSGGARLYPMVALILPLSSVV